MGLAIVDWASLQSNFDNDDFAIGLVIDAFLEAVDEMLVKLRAAIEAKDGKAVAMTSHSLKGAMSNFGARDAVEFAQLLETHGYEGLKGNEPQTFLALEMAVAELVDELKARVAA